MKRTMTEWARVTQLAKDECANHFSGFCLAHDLPCIQIGNRSQFQEHGKLACRYFMECILPLDKVLHVSLMGGAELKQCEVCRKPIVAPSNRAKYCKECAHKMQRKQQAKFEREKYERKKGVKS